MKCNTGARNTKKKKNNTLHPHLSTAYLNNNTSEYGSYSYLSSNNCIILSYKIPFPFLMNEC